MSKTPAQIAEEAEEFAEKAAQLAKDAEQFAEKAEKFSEETAKNRLEHLKFIQAVITRMAGNSFQLKAWSLAFVAAVLTLITKDAQSKYVCITLVPIFMFWALDAYYLRQERLFRTLYVKVAKSEIDSAEYTLDTSRFDRDVKSVPKVMLSVTLLSFYGVLLVVVTLVIVFAGCCSVMPLIRVAT